MSIYNDLDIRIKEVAENEKQYEEFKELVTQNFEGKKLFLDLPVELQETLVEWELDNE